MNRIDFYSLEFEALFHAFLEDFSHKFLITLTSQKTAQHLSFYPIIQPMNSE